jgi:hypothetical protein
MKEKLKTAFEHLLMRFNYLDPNNDYVEPLDYRHVVHTPNQSHEKRMEAARQYLRKRGKYYIENQGGWVPTKAANTDVAKTWSQYITQTQGRAPVRVAK